MTAFVTLTKMSCLEPTPGTEFPPSTVLERSKSRTTTRTASTKKPKRPKSPESAIDILYENQRGGFLCGIPLFSSKALGNLDPPPWTNFAHRPSPTDITNAQPPDPSWEWAWPEWRINRDTEPDIEVDEDGWEYSFMFSKKFSWHRARWWNSFVRRRAWIRKRVRKSTSQGDRNSAGYITNDSNMLNPEYFSVRPSAELKRERERESIDRGRRASSRSRSPSRASSRGASRASGATGSRRVASRTSISTTRSRGDEELEEEKPDIEDVETLLQVLRRSRIDREKIEAVDNYLEHADEDLEGLKEVMHDIMSLFVFQASRRALLTKLTDVYDQTVAAAEAGSQKNKEKDNAEDGAAPGKQKQTQTEEDNKTEIVGDDMDHKRRAENLRETVKHADEEVRRLEYWSDVKHIAEEGDSKGAVDHRQGWHDPEWRGVDNSAPAMPRPPSS